MPITSASVRSGSMSEILACPVDGLVISRTPIDVSRLLGQVSLASTRISMVLSGRVVVMFHGQTRDYEAGDVMLFRGGQRYDFLPETSDGLTVNIDLQSDYLDSWGLSESELADAIDISPGANLVVMHLAFGTRPPSAGLPTAVQSTITAWLGSAICIKQASASERALRLRQDIHHKWDQRRSLKDLSAILNCHPVTVARYFPLYFGCTQREYVRRLRTQHAIGHLLSCDDSVTDVAHRCGFADHSHLTRTLRLLIGATPVEVRRFGELSVF